MSETDAATDPFGKLTAGMTEEAKAQAALMLKATRELLMVAPSKMAVLSVLASLWASTVNEIQCPHRRMSAVSQFIVHLSLHLHQIIDAEHTDDAGVTKH